MGLLYLLQPSELIGTNRYKIGCSADSSLKRIQSYRKGTRYLHICETEYPYEHEKILKEIFNDNFTLIAGAEYFEGDEATMIKLFLDYVSHHLYAKPKPIYTIVYDSNEKPQIYIDPAISEQKIDYESDELFGGSKKLVWFRIIKSGENYIIAINYINKIRNAIKISTINVNTADLHDMARAYFQKIIRQSAIKDGKICDLKDEKFVNQLIKYKFKIKKPLHLTEDDVKLHLYNTSFEQCINDLILSDAIIDNKYYCSIDKITWDKISYYKLSFYGMHPKCTYNVCLIDGTLYFERFLLSFHPHIAEINMCTKQVYFINYYGMYINSCTRSEIWDPNDIERVTLYDPDKPFPWTNPSAKKRYEDKILNYAIEYKPMNMFQNFHQVSRDIINGLL
jgi:hypothetical protein